jgi:gliding motility-associated-like protein
MKKIPHIIGFVGFLVIFYFDSLAQSQTVNNGASTRPIIFPGTSCNYTWVNDNPSIGLPATGTGNIPSFVGVNTGNMPVTATIKATPVNLSFAYIANTASNTVTVINTTTNAVVKTIPVGQYPAQVAFSQDGSLAYVTNNVSNTISVINTTSNTVTATIPGGQSPFGIAVSPDGNLVYVTNINSKMVSVLQASTGGLVATIPVGNSPRDIAESSDGAILYVTNQFSASVSVISTATNTVIATVPVGSFPFGLMIDNSGSLVYVVNGSSNNISVISTASNTIVETIPAGTQPYDVAISADDHYLYVTDQAFQSVAIIDRNLPNYPTTTVHVGGLPTGISLSADGSELYVVNTNGSVTVLNAITGGPITTVATGANPITSGNFINGKSICSPVTYTIKVNPANVLSPVLTAGPAAGSIVACAGTASSSPAIAKIPVSGNNLTSAITATAPAGFEISLSEGSGFGASVLLSPSGGTVDAAVYIRSSASAPPGSISGAVTFTSDGVADQQIAVKGTVNALPMVNPVDNQTVFNGQQTAAVHFTGTARNYQWTGSTAKIGLPASGVDDVPSVYAINVGTTPIVDVITVTPVTPHFAYIPNGLNNTVTAVNMATGLAATTIDVGSSPFGVAITADGNLAYITNTGSNNLSVINTATNTVVATIPAGFRPFQIVLSPDGTKAYTTNPYSNSVEVISTVTKSIAATIPVNSPDGLVISPDGSTLYVSGGLSGQITVINTSTNVVSATIPLGQQAGRLAISPDGTQLYAVNISGISVINTATYAVVSNIPVSIPQNIAISPDGRYLYVTQGNSANANGDVGIIDRTTNAITEIQTGALNLGGITVSDDGKSVYVINEGPSAYNVLIIDASTGNLTQTYGLSPGVGAEGNFVAGGVHCDGVPITFTITVLPTLQTITSTGSLTALTTVYGTPSASSAILVSGDYITDANGIIALPPTGFEISTDNVHFSNSVVNIGGPGTVAPSPIYIRLTATTLVGNYSGNIILSTIGGTSVDVHIPVSTVVPAPLNITANDIHKPYGTTITAGAGFTAFTSTGLQNGETIGSVTADYGAGAVALEPVGTYPGSVTLSAATGGTFSPANYAISYLPGNLVVNAAVLTITADNKTKIFLAPNPPLTFTYSGFVNNDGPAMLTVQPVISTTAVTSSPAGEYPITVSGAMSPDYTFVYIDGSLTITPSTQLINIPNAFTPNGDGINDTWNLKVLESFPTCTVEVYNRYGERLFSSVGYGVPWDGKYRGATVPFGTYYYIINLKTTPGILAGFVSVIK